jgi:hypothetical protein
MGRACNARERRGIYVQYRGVTIDRLWFGHSIYWPLVYTTRNYTLQIIDSQTSVLSLLQFAIAVSRQRLLRGRFLSFPNSGPLITAGRAELLSTENSTNWILGWRPFHTNLLVFSSQADFLLNWTFSLTNQLLHFTSLHFTSLNWTLTTDYSWVWVWALCYDRRSVGQSVLE